MVTSDRSIRVSQRRINFAPQFKASVRSWLPLASSLALSHCNLWNRRHNKSNPWNRPENYVVIYKIAFALRNDERNRHGNENLNCCNTQSITNRVHVSLVPLACQAFSSSPNCTTFVDLIVLNDYKQSADVSVTWQIFYIHILCNKYSFRKKRIPRPKI